MEEKGKMGEHHPSAFIKINTEAWESIIIRLGMVTGSRDSEGSDC